MHGRQNTVSSLKLFLKNRISSSSLVQDLAARFADGRLSTKSLLQAEDEQLAEMLIQVRGIGRVSASMMFVIINAHVIHSGQVRRAVCSMMQSSCLS